MWFFLQIAAVGFWAAINVLDSLLVRRYRGTPVALMWNQSYFSVPLLAAVALTMKVGSSWALILFLVGVCGYAGDLVFFATLKRIDVSVTNIAWVILSVFLSAGGYAWFGERWSLTQTIGVLFVLISILFLSVWHKRVGSGAALLLLPALAAMYTPFYLVQKAALHAGEGIVPVFFWSLIGRELISLAIPLGIPSLRSIVIGTARRADAAFFAINAAVILLFFLATYFTTRAFLVGPLSLVAIVGNVQPFFVLLFACMTIRFFPSFAPKELTDSGSVAAKLACFLIAFLGLALLALPQ